MRIALHRFYEIGRRVLLFWAAGLLALASLHAHAATTYTFPGNLPAGCTGSNGNYSCTSLSLNYQDAIVIAAPKPATITVKSNFSTNQNKINAGGAASDLTFIVKGALDLNWNSTLNANVTASTVQTDNSVIFGGNINATGDIVLGDSVHVPGSITSSAGQIQLGNNDTVDGNVTGALDVVIKYQGNVAGSVTSSSSQVRLENNVTVNGNVTAVKDVTIKFQGHVVGSVTSTSKQVQLENEA
ncbi:MAG: hypothetical protein VB032_03960, partial [Burkholderiaceae bacterium]|nr:hypothetical protein [Burkholderiaceae bacterium]